MRNYNRSLFKEVLSTMGNALVIAAAVSRGGKPDAGNLRGLGIDPAEFRNIRRHY